MRRTLLGRPSELKDPAKAVTGDTEQPADDAKSNKAPGRSVSKWASRRRRRARAERAAEGAPSRGAPFTSHRRPMDGRGASPAGSPPFSSSQRRRPPTLPVASATLVSAAP